MADLGEGSGGFQNNEIIIISDEVVNEVIVESSPHPQPEYEEPMNISAEHAVDESRDVLPPNQVQNNDLQGETSDGPAAKVRKLDDEEKKIIPNLSLDDSVCEEQKCSICLDMWSNYGDHRLCCLKCGHLFGLSCLKKWLEPLRAAERRCPECNTKANKRDIRVLYAKKLVAMDTAELEKVKEELKISERMRLSHERTIANLQSKHQAYETQISTLQSVIVNLERSRALQNKPSSLLNHIQDIELCPKEGCRVMAYNAWHNAMVVTTLAQKAAGDEFGIRKVILDTMSPSIFIPTHKKFIRDITFSTFDPNIGVTVGVDEQAVLFDIRSCAVMHTYHQPKIQFWSCCWSRENGNNFHVGTQRGQLLKYDLRDLRGSVETVENPLDKSPLVSLAAVPSFNSRFSGVTGLIACHLQGCYAYMNHGDSSLTQRLDIKGPFVSVKFDENNKHALVSCRPNSVEQHVRHYVCLVSKDTAHEARCEIIHTLNGGKTQQRLSRPCHMYLPDDTLVCAGNESSSCVQLWSMSTGNEVHKLSVSAPIIDTSSFRTGDNVYLALLSPQKLSVHKYEEPLSQSL